MKAEEKELRTKVNQYERDNAHLEKQVVELTKFISWEEIAHEQFTASMVKDGFSNADINSAANM